MQQNGRITRCDRCGAETFSKLLKVRELDGGFTHSNTFEQLPAGWEYNGVVGDLCPRCNEEFQAAIDKFKSAVHEMHQKEKEKQNNDQT